MNDDERKILLHTVYVLNLFLERIGQFDLAQQYNKAIEPNLRLVAAAMKHSSANEKS